MCNWLSAAQEVTMRRFTFTAEDLDAYRGSLEDYFLLNPPRSTREAQTAIARATGVRRGLTQVRAFLKKLSACAGARSGPSRPRPTPRSKRNSFGPSSARG